MFYKRNYILYSHSTLYYIICIISKTISIYNFKLFHKLHIVIRYSYMREKNRKKALIAAIFRKYFVRIVSVKLKLPIIDD